jgi:hypothetical protein
VESRHPFSRGARSGVEKGSMKMKNGNDPFDLSKMALNAETIAELMPFQKAAAAKPPKRRSRVEFVMLPYDQTIAAAGAMKNAALAVMVELANQMFKKHTAKVALGNSALRSVGISHKAKLRALHQLEAAGMVVVDWRRRKSPRVTILWDTKTRP